MRRMNKEYRQADCTLKLEYSLGNIGYVMNKILNKEESDGERFRANERES